MFLKPPREPTIRIKDATTHPETDFVRLRPVLVKAGDLLKSGAAVLSDAWERLPQVKVDLWHRGQDLEADLKRLLSTHYGTDNELGSFLLRCGRWTVEVRLLRMETDADTNPELLDWDPFLMDLKNVLDNQPEDRPPDNRVVADAILRLAEQTGAGFRTLSEGQVRLAGRMDRMDGRLDGVDESLKTLTEGQKTLTEGQATLTERVDTLTDIVGEPQEGQKPLTEGVQALTDEVKTLTDIVGEPQEGQKPLTEGQARIEGRLDGIDKSLKTLTEDMGDLKGDVAVRVTRTRCFILAQALLGLKVVKVLERADLNDLIEPLLPTLAPGTPESFCVADLVMDCVHRTDGTRAYVAVEASFTANEGDSNRALRNADLLTQSTGVKAHAVVSSVQNDRAVQKLVDDGDILWYRLSRKSLKPD